MIERELGTERLYQKLAFVSNSWESKVINSKNPLSRFLIRKLKRATHWHVAFFIAYSGRGFSGKRRRTSTKNSGTK